MTARCAAIAGAITAAVVAVVVAGIALFASDLGIGLPEGLEDAAVQQYRNRGADGGVGVRGANVWSDCAVLNMTDGKSLIMLTNAGGWRIARVSQGSSPGYFDTDDIASQDSCLGAATGEPLT